MEHILLIGVYLIVFVTLLTALLSGSNAQSTYKTFGNILLVLVCIEGIMTVIYLILG